MDTTNTNHEPALRGEAGALELPAFGTGELGPALKDTESYADFIAATHAELGLRCDPEFLVELPVGSTIAFGATLNNTDRWEKTEDGWLKIAGDYPFPWDEETLLSYYPAAEGWRYLLETPAVPVEG